MKRKCIFSILFFLLYYLCFSQQRSESILSINDGKINLECSLDKYGVISTISNKDNIKSINIAVERIDDKKIAIEIKNMISVNRYLITTNESNIVLSGYNTKNEAYNIIQIDMPVIFTSSVSNTQLNGEMCGSKFMLFKEDGAEIYYPDYVFDYDKEIKKKYSYKFDYYAYIYVFYLKNSIWVKENDSTVEIKGINLSYSNQKTNIINYLILSVYDEPISTYFIPLALYYSNKIMKE